MKNKLNKKEHKLFAGYATASMETFQQGIKDGSILNSHAYLFSIYWDEKQDLPAMGIIGRDRDVYDLLNNVSSYVTPAMQISNSQVVGVFSQGWAAPLGGDYGSPSSHPDAVRVQLIHMVSQAGKQMSAIKRADSVDIDIIADEGTGSLADALNKCVAECLYQLKEKDKE